MVGDPDGFDRGTYGRSFADVYDSWYGEVTDAGAMVRFVDRFGESLDILELGVGSGRLATPLGAAGHMVVGVDISPEMLERRADPRAFSAVRADMCELPIDDSTFDLVLIAFNTIFNLIEATAQQRCFTEAARCLRPGGRVVVEADVPLPPDPTRDRLVSTRSVGADRVVLTASIRDSERQTITGQHVEITEEGTRLRPWRIRYADPSELDDMARAAGLTLADRYSSWAAEPFDGGSDRHISVYGLSDP